jgi:hypothetical protein
MTMVHDDLPLLLLDLLAPQRPLPVERMQMLDADDWQAIDAMATRHRLRPLLHYRLRSHGDIIDIPADLRAQWMDNHRQAALRSLTRQRELAILHEMMAGSGIDYIALKGAYLAWSCYPEPGLRPLRDLDILVPYEQAMAVFNALLDRGYTRTESYMGDPYAYLQSSHQLPPLRNPQGETTVEIHTMLFHRDDRRADVRDPSGDPAYWARTTEQPMAGRPVRFPSPEDILIHLIEHAVYGHQFDNGPLLLSDIAFLAETHAIDWPLFWRLADEAECRRGAVLSLALVRRYWPGLAIGWPDGEAIDVPADVVEAAARALLRDRDHWKSDHLLVHARLAEGKRRTAHIWRRLFPARSHIALIYPVRMGSPLIGYYYFKRLWALATERLPTVLATMTGKRSSQTVDGLLLIHRWLERRG